MPWFFQQKIMTSTFVRWRNFFSMVQPCGRMDVVADARRLACPDALPRVFRLLLLDCARADRVRRWLEAGWCLGYYRSHMCSLRARDAIERLARISQESTLVAWLPRLLGQREWPVFSLADLQAAEKDGVDLARETRYILQEASKASSLLVLHPEHEPISFNQQQDVQEMNQTLSAHHASYAQQLFLAESLPLMRIKRDEWISFVVYALCVGFLSKFVNREWLIFISFAGLPTLFVLKESWQRNRSGVPWRKQRYVWQIYFPFMVLSYGISVLLVSWLEKEMRMQAGMLFGFATTLLWWAKEGMNWSKMVQSFRRLRKEGKLPPQDQRVDAWWAWKELWLRPRGNGLILAGVFFPPLSLLVFRLFDVDRSPEMFGIVGVIFSLLALVLSRLSSFFQRRVLMKF